MQLRKFDGRQYGNDGYHSLSTIPIGFPHMWFDSLPNDSSWAALWKGYVRCGCGGIRKLVGLCPSCSGSLPSSEWVTVRMNDGAEQQVPHAYAGGEGRYEDWVYLIMLEREWLRPITDADRFLSIVEGSRPSPRAIVLLVFWTYFETRIERLFREMLTSLPAAVTDDLLRRYASIGSRLDRLYRVAFGSTYWADLEGLGYGSISALLKRVHQRRNEFAHGHPEAIDDALVKSLIESLEQEHESWIAVFNHRMAAKASIGVASS